MTQLSYLSLRSQMVTIATLMVAGWFSTASAQEPASRTFDKDQPPTTLGAAMTRLHPETSVSLGAAAQLTAPRRTETPFNMLSTGVAPSAAVFATIRQSFRPALGYSVNFSYSRTNDHYTYSPLPGTAGYTSVSKPLPVQAMTITGAAKYLQTEDSVRLVGECGTGRTLMSIGIAHAHADSKPYTALVMCPPHLVLKWAREVLITGPRARAFIVYDLRNGGDPKNPHGVVEVIR